MMWVSEQVVCVHPPIISNCRWSHSLLTRVSPEEPAEKSCNMHSIIFPSWSMNYYSYNVHSMVYQCSFCHKNLNEIKFLFFKKSYTVLKKISCIYWLCLFGPPLPYPSLPLIPQQKPLQKSPRFMSKCWLIIMNIKWF